MGKITKDHFPEAKKMFRRHMKVRGKHFTKFKGSSTEICNQILDRLWNGEFFQTSLGHFNCFYSRDFSMSLQALLDLGYRDKVIKTLNYALDKYEKADGIKTYINTKGKPVNFPNVYSPDSVALMFRAVAIVNDKKMIDRYKFFLQRELFKFNALALNKVTGEIKRHFHFGGMRDHAKRDSSCYDTVMAAIISREADALGLENPLRHTNFKKMLLDHYWLDHYFRDDRATRKMTADANIYPFWYGVVEDIDKQELAITSMQKANLDKPFPIKYVPTRKHKGKTIGAVEKLVKNWQADAIWPMSALPFIDLVSDNDEQKAKEYLLQYKEKIEELGTFIEVYTPDGKPFKSSLYSSDEGLIWCAQYLVLANHFKLK